MDIKLTTLMCGPEGSFPPGTELLGLDDDKARELIAAHSAVEITRRVKETATARPGETTTVAEQAAAGHLANIARAGQGRRRRGAAVSPEPTSPAGVEAGGADVSTGAAE